MKSLGAMAMNQEVLHTEKILADRKMPEDGWSKSLKM